LVKTISLCWEMYFTPIFVFLHTFYGLINVGPMFYDFSAFWYKLHQNPIVRFRLL